jgi:hypothetical protein
LDFAGELWTTVETVTFGRDADIQLDTNPHLHRHTGAFVPDGGAWWVHNLGAKLHLTVIGESGARADLPPGTRHALASSAGLVRVVAGRRTYEITYSIAAAHGAAVEIAPRDDATMTVQVDLVLTPREIDFLVTFARPFLLGLAEPTPTYAEVASLWQVSPKTLDNALQSIKRKFRHAGLIRDPNLDALVLKAIQHSLVTRADLDHAQLDAGMPVPSGKRRRVEHEP